MSSSRSIVKMAEEEQRKKIPLVPENLLKKRKAYQALKATQAKQALLEKKQRKGKEFKFKRLEWFLHDAWRQQRDKVRLRRLEVKPHGLEVPDEHSLAFVVRIQRINGVSLTVQRTIARLRLKKIFSGVFFQVTPKTIKTLRVVEPYVTWGFPNLKSVRELILKRGQAKVKNKIIPLTDNTVIEEHLGKFGVICLEDLIHEIAFPGKNFQVISGFLCPFHLSVARHATKNRVGFLKEVGSPGYRGECINQLIRQLN
ncbi:ribosomal protein L7 like 1 [Rhinolophus ferrumequinum]|uniref:Ribosomal protein L7 like 1 n=2 Tax=Rhinolophus ferrumequinum TaxID=59479 RepID=A0A671DRQ8_RHIFE|nr:60S ribosomal protein L7-like 1 [Rhinolophus ferrumequinum]XP_032959065.1 60S ribosomal protein L7-like 1 [Rhinolophus ferrumequinum]KAF6365224.1 ribosomal protein L7 like 1 [Rhinolophus ferrumequinum]